MNTSLLKQAIDFMLVVMGMVLLLFAVVNLFLTNVLKFDQESSIFSLVIFVVGVTVRYFRLKKDQKL